MENRNDNIVLLKMRKSSRNIAARSHHGPHAGLVDGEVLDRLQESLLLRLRQEIRIACGVPRLRRDRANVNRLSALEAKWGSSLVSFFQNS